MSDNGLIDISGGSMKILRDNLNQANQRNIALQDALVMKHSIAQQMGDMLRSGQSQFIALLEKCISALESGEAKSQEEVLAEMKPIVEGYHKAKAAGEAQAKLQHQGSPTPAAPS